MAILDFIIDKTCTYIWNNLLFLRISFIIFLFIIMYIYNNRKLLYKTFLPLKYEDLCLKIGSLLNINKNYWREFGPNSSFDSEKDPIKQDLKLWENIKALEILPNNKKIKDLIEQNETIIPAKDKFLFEKMKHHIVTFEAHMIDDAIDYRNNQFPMEFEKLIYLKCENSNKKQINTISKWLKNKLYSRKYNHLKITSMWLFGSILKGMYKTINDIDVIIYSDITSLTQIVELSELIKKIRLEFTKSFKKDLNFISFTKKEEQSLYDFIEQIDIKRKL